MTATPNAGNTTTASMQQPSSLVNPPQPPQAAPPAGSAEETLGLNVTANTFTTHDVVLGKGNGINSLPGNLRFRKIIVKYKPLYAATPRSMKGTVAELVINEIACLDPPGRFLEPQTDQRFREVSRKRAIEKTCQALREKKNNIARPQQITTDHEVEEQPVAPNEESAFDKETDMPMQIEKEPPAAAPPADDSKSETSENEGTREAVSNIMENDVLYGGRGRRHFHRVANQRFLELVKMSRKEYHESRCKKAVAQRIVNEWKGQTPPGRFLQQDPKTEKWYEIKEAKIMEKTCQALRDLKRERGPAGIKQGISDRMVDPWDKSMPFHMQPHMKGPMQQPMNGSMAGQPMPPQGHHPYPHHGGPWMGQSGMFPPQQMAPNGMMPQAPQHMPYVPMPPQGAPYGMGQGPPPTANTTDRAVVDQSQANQGIKEEEMQEAETQLFNGSDLKTAAEDSPARPMEMDPPKEKEAEPMEKNEPEPERVPTPAEVPQSPPVAEPTPLPDAKEPETRKIPMPAEVAAEPMPPLEEATPTMPTESAVKPIEDKPESEIVAPADQAPAVAVPEAGPPTDPIPAAFPPNAPEEAFAVTIDQETSSEKEEGPKSQPKDTSALMKTEASEAKTPPTEEAPSPVAPTEVRPETPEAKSPPVKEQPSTKAPTEDAAKEDEPTQAAPRKEEKNEQEGKKQHSGKKDNHKNGELEAATLLANMFR